MKAHLSKYTPGKFGRWKFSLVSAVKKNVMLPKRQVSVQKCSFQANYRVWFSKIHRKISMTIESTQHRFVASVKLRMLS